MSEPIDYKAQCEELIRGSQAREFELKKLTAERAKLQEKLDFAEKSLGVARDSEHKAHIRLRLADRYIDVVDDFLRTLMSELAVHTAKKIRRSEAETRIREWAESTIVRIGKMTITTGKTLDLAALEKKA